MRLRVIPGGFALDKEQEEIGRCLAAPTARGGRIESLCIAPRWRRRGYGSYLLKEVVRRFGGYGREHACVLTAPLPQQEAELAFWAKFGFAPEGGGLVRRHVPDLTAVRFAQEFLAAHLVSPRLCVDATCGNGGDTLFLCGLSDSGQVLGFDLQPKAIEATRARLDAAGIPAGRVRLFCQSHDRLLDHVGPGTADTVMFNFGWLPGADHSVYSTAATSLPALEAALTALRPGGILSAVLYSGSVIGSAEKRSVLSWLRGLPLAQYTVLVCEFANWAESAPLPCFVIKRP